MSTSKPPPQVRRFPNSEASRRVQIRGPQKGPGWVPDQFHPGPPHRGMVWSTTVALAADGVGFTSPSAPLYRQGFLDGGTPDPSVSGLYGAVSGLYVEPRTADCLIVRSVRRLSVSSCAEWKSNSAVGGLDLADVSVFRQMLRLLGRTGSSRTRADVASGILAERCGQ